MAQPPDKKPKKRSTKTGVPASSPWSIRGVSYEARNAATLAARRSGKTLGEWVEAAIMTAAHEALKGASPPARTNEDTLGAILQQLEARDKTLEEIASKVAALENDRKGGWLARLLRK